jgi:hypothetical protein
MRRKQAVRPGKRRTLRAPGRKDPPARAAAAEAGRGPSSWRLVRGGAALHRSYQFPNAGAAASFSQFAVHVASHVQLPLFVRLAGTQVTLVLRGPATRRTGLLAAVVFDDAASLA